LAAIYRKRSGGSGTLPPETFTRLFEEINGEWEHYSDKNGINMSKKNHSEGVISLKISFSVKAPLDLVKEVFTYGERKNQSRLLEQIDSTTGIYHMILHNPLPGILKNREQVVLVNLTKMEDGRTVILRRSVEHPNAPPTPGWKTIFIFLGGGIFSPIEGGTHFVGMISLGSEAFNKHNKIAYWIFKKRMMKVRNESEKRYLKSLKSL